MRSINLLIFIALFTSSIAQPTLNSNEMAPFGSSWTMIYTQSYNVIDTSIQGANVTWNFAAMLPSTTSFTTTIVDPAQTPYATSFPNSNYAYHETPTTAYRYFNLTSTKMERVGSWTGSGGLRTYSDPQIEYVFPLTIGSYSYDTWMNSASSSGGIYELSGIGYGTLITPTGTFNDAIMVRVFLEESFLSFYTYFWYSSTSGIILLQYIDGDGFFIPKLLSYASSISLATGINSKKEPISLNYSNPVSDNLILVFNSTTNENFTYEIINSLGQKIMNGNIESTSNTSQIRMKHLDNGLYLVTLREEKSGAVKTIKVLKL